jgi:hypothetical protein
MRFINDNKQSLKQISFCTYISERLGAVGLALLLIIFSCVKTSDEKCLINNKYFDFFFSSVASRSLANCRQRQNYVFSPQLEAKSLSLLFLGTIKSHLCVYYTRKSEKKCFSLWRCRGPKPRERGKVFPVLLRLEIEEIFASTRNQRDVISIQNLISS